MQEKKKCKSTAKATGLPCKGRTILSDGLCLFHSPLYRAKLIEIAQKGGQAPKLPLPQIKHFNVRSSKDAKRYLEHVTTQVARGKLNMHPRDMTNLFKLYLEVEQKVDLLDRVEKLEKERGQKKNK